MGLTVAAVEADLEETRTELLRLNRRRLLLEEAARLLRTGEHEEIVRARLAVQRIVVGQA